MELRRLGVAAGVTVLVFLAADVAIAVASSTADPLAEGGGFVLPPVAMGDAVVYDWAETRSTVTMRQGLQWGWTTGETVRMPDGRDLPSDTLLAVTTDAREPGALRVQAVRFDGGTSLVVARGFAGEAVDALGSDLAGLPVRSDGNASYLYEALVFDGPPQACTAAGRWSGMEVGSRHLVLPTCSSPELDLPVGLVLQPMGLDVMDGRRVAHYNGSGGGHDVELLFGDGLPVPLQVTHRWTLGGEPITTQATLTGYAPGTTPRSGLPSVAVAVSAPPVVYLAPATRLLVEETGVDLPFLLGDALAAAAPQTAWFLGQHPDAFVGYAVLSNSERNGVPTVDWEFVLQDATAGLRVQTLWPRTDVPRALAPATAVVVTQTASPAEAHKPDAVPRAADLLAAASWYRGEASDCYGYWLAVDGLRLWAGDCATSQDIVPAAGLTGVTFSSSFAEDAVQFDGDGRITGWGKSILALDDTTQATPGVLPPHESDPRRPTLLSRSLELSAPEWTAVGSVAVGAGLLVLLWPLLKGLPGLALFTRLRQPELLDQPTRARIHGLVEANPGIHFGDLQRRSGVANGTLVHHLRALEAGGLLAPHVNGHYTSYFVHGERPTKLSLALRSHGARLVWSSVQANPGISNRGLADATRLTVSTVNYHLHRFERDGLVRIDRTGFRLSVHAAA